MNLSYEKDQSNKNYVLRDDKELLNTMVLDQSAQSPLYRPGPYWENKAKRVINEINQFGIHDFRGTSSLVGMSYADNMDLDIRNFYIDGVRKAGRMLTKVFPFNKLFESQLRKTKMYADEYLNQVQQLLNLRPRTRELLEKYKVPYSTLGDCQKKISVDGQEYAIHYLDLLEQHDNLAQKLDFTKARTFFEIGGGFGTNVHLLLENYPNIRKVLYLDIPPNLYVGTQYLKSFYGDAVCDYKQLKNQKEIKFKTDDTLEILCITPWQIENFKDEIDLFTNSHSFVEMPLEIVQNYVNKMLEFKGAENMGVGLISYDNFNLDSTFHPDKLKVVFKQRTFENYNSETLLDSSRSNFYFVTPGKLSKS